MKFFASSGLLRGSDATAGDAAPLLFTAAALVQLAAAGVLLLS